MDARRGDGREGNGPSLGLGGRAGLEVVADVVHPHRGGGRALGGIAGEGPPVVDHVVAEVQEEAGFPLAAAGPGHAGHVVGEEVVVDADPAVSDRGDQRRVAVRTFRVHRAVERLAEDAPLDGDVAGLRLAGHFVPFVADIQRLVGAPAGRAVVEDDVPRAEMVIPSCASADASPGRTRRCRMTTSCVSLTQSVKFFRQMPSPGAVWPAIVR